jgi:iron complex outermembrane receptor protein
VDRDGDGQTDGFRLRRDLDYQKFNVNGQAQYRFGGASTLTLAGGTAQLTSPVQSGIGTLQADGFGYTYGQLRLQSGDFFAQVFLNANDAGDSYVYGSGEQVVDEGLQWNVQSQYIFGVNPLDTEFTVGGEVNLIEPRTGETITGRNEGDDSINLYGAYAQTSSTLSEKFDLTLAARLDYNNVEEIPLVSPRAALVFKINPQNTLRATYNRVYSAPGTNSNFLDLAAQVTSFEGTPFEFVLQGRGAVDGFSFGEFRNNRQVRLFLPTGIPGADFGDPVSLAQYPVLPVYGATAQEFASRLQSGQSFSGPLANFTPEQLQAYAQLLGGIAQSTAPTTTASEEDATPGVLLGIPNSEAQLGYDVVGDPTDIEPLGQTQTQTFELGYRGVLGSKLIFTVDGYYERKNNFIGPLRVESPLVYLNPQFVAGNVQQTLATNPQLAQAFAQLSTSTQLSDEQLISLIAATFGQTASGVVQPNEPVLASNGTRVGGLVSYRNFGEIDYYGVDVNAEFRPMRQLDLFANASYVSDGFFTGEELGEDPESDLNVALNAPTFKTRGGFRARLDNGLSFTGAASYVDDFRVASGPYVGTVDSYFLVDLGLGYDFQDTVPGLRLNVTAKNVLDNDHREFVGAPLLGRLVLARLTYDIPISR